jgi:hypothetical protein
MNERARTRGASEVHAAEEIPAQESTGECTEVHAAEVHAPAPLFRGGGHQEEWEKRLREAVEKTLQERARKKAERQQFALRRMHGLAARHARKLNRNSQEKAMTCRYLNRYAVQCTGEPVDPDGEVLLCTRHLGNALELLKAKGFTITAPATDKENEA